MNDILNYVKGIAFLMLFITFVINILPDSSYKKYVKIFTGLVLVITVIKPVTDFLGIGDTFYNSLSKYNSEFDSEAFENEISGIQNNMVENYIEENSSGEDELNGDGDSEDENDIELNTEEYNVPDININVEGIN